MKLFDGLIVKMEFACDESLISDVFCVGIGKFYKRAEITWVIRSYVE